MEIGASGKIDFAVLSLRGFPSALSQPRCGEGRSNLRPWASNAPALPLSYESISVRNLEQGGGIEPLDIHPTVFCHRFRRPVWAHPASLFGKLVRHPGTAPGSQAWHARILLLDQCRFWERWLGLGVMLPRRLFVREEFYF